VVQTVSSSLAARTEIRRRLGGDAQLALAVEVALLPVLRVREAVAQLLTLLDCG
jgi:hypothetical protein